MNSKTQLWKGAASTMLAALTACSTAPTPPTAPMAMQVPATAPVPEMPRDPATITRTGDGDDYRVEYCSRANPNKKYVLIVNGQKRNGGTTGADGCFRTTLRDGAVRPGSNIVYEIDGKNVASETVPQGAVGGNSGTGQPQQPRPQQPAQPPAPPPLPRADISKVRDNAENHARCLANAVVNAYGSYESYRYNFFKGFRKGISRYNFENMGDVRNGIDYQEGAQIGEQEGVSQGQVAGRAQGMGDGSSEAAAQVRQRYEEIVDRQTPPNLEKNVPIRSNTNLVANIGEPRSIEDRIGGLENEYQVLVLKQRYGSGDDFIVLNSSMWRSEWSLISYYRSRDFDMSLVRGWYRDDWAFNAYLRQDFSRCASLKSYYDKISSSAEYSNSGEATNAFRSTFKHTYDQVIDEKWINKVREDRPDARETGKMFGTRVAREYARDLGYNTSFRIAYTQEARLAYSASFSNSFNEAFDRNVAFYEKNVVPVVNTAQLVDANGERKGLVIGVPLNVALLDAKNIGRQPGEAKVTITGENVANTVTKTIQMEPSATLKGDKTVKGVGYLAPHVAPNASVRVSIRVNDRSVDDQFTMDWGNLIRTFAVQTDANAIGVQTDYIVRVIQAENEPIYGGSMNDFNDWEKDDDKLFLKQAVHAAESLPRNVSRANFVGLASRLSKMIGPKPNESRFLGFGTSTKDKEWDSFHQWLERMKKAR